MVGDSQENGGTALATLQGDSEDSSTFVGVHLPHLGHTYGVNHHKCI